MDKRHSSLPSCLTLMRTSLKMQASKQVLKINRQTNHDVGRLIGLGLTWTLRIIINKKIWLQNSENTWNRSNRKHKIVNWLPTAPQHMHTHSNTHRHVVLWSEILMLGCRRAHRTGRQGKRETGHLNVPPPYAVTYWWMPLSPGTGATYRVCGWHCRRW